MENEMNNAAAIDTPAIDTPANIFETEYPTSEAAYEAAKAAQAAGKLGAINVRKYANCWRIIDTEAAKAAIEAQRKAALATAKAADATAPKAEKPAKAAKAKAAKAETKPADKPADTPAAPAKGKRGLAARMEKQAAEKAKAAAKAKAKPAAPAGGAKDMHYSMQTLPTLEQIAAGLPGMNNAAREGFINAAKGIVPAANPFNVLMATHANYVKPLGELKALRDKGDLAGLKAWKGGLGTRMNSSSTIPLGRFHQQCIIALTVKAKASEERKAKKAAKAASKAAPAPSIETPAEAAPIETAVEA